MFGLSITTLLKLGAILAAVMAVLFAVHEVVKSIGDAAVKPVVAAQAAKDAVTAAKVATVQATTAAVDTAASDTSAAHQTALATQAAVVKQKRPSHVPVPAMPPVAPGCVTYGLVRQHDAAALGVDPDSLPLPAAATDGACSPVTDAALADAIGDNYAAARANAQELTDLQKRDAAQVDATKPQT